MSAGRIFQPHSPQPPGREAHDGPPPHAERSATSERGATVVLVALMLTVLLGMVGLAIDGSNAYFQQQRMQIAADAAALAGARLLALDQAADTARNEAQELGQINGADALTAAVVDGNTAVETSAERTVETYFARILGMDNFTVGARARAGYITVGRAGNLLPVTTMCPAGGFTYGQIVELKDGNLNAPGNFGWLSWNGSNSTPGLADFIENPDTSPVLEVGDWMETMTGEKYGGFVRAALDKWIGVPVTIPLYDQAQGSGNNAQYRVCGFAQFVLLGHTNKTLTGRFVRNVIPGEALGGVSDLGSRDIRMQE